MSGHPVELAWTLRPAPVAFCLALLLGYAWHVRRFTARAWAWAAGVAVILLALISPLNALAENYLFSAHMAQHILFVLVAPALLWVGLPPGGGSSRRAPAVSWIAGIGAMAVWHIPVVFHVAMSHPLLHKIEWLSLLAGGGLYWRPILSPAPEARLNPLPQAAAYLFTSCLACTSIGIAITFAPSLLYPDFLPEIRQAWGLPAALDQQIGGLLMWVPCCLVYLTAIMAMFARWYGEDAAQAMEA